MSMRCRIGIAVLALFSGVPADAAATASGTVPFLPARGGAVIVPALVDGRGPYPFLVDTGASHTVVRVGLARKLGLSVVDRTDVITPVGHESREVVRLGRVSVGSAVADVRASVVEADWLRMDNDRFDGLLGQDFLSRFDYTIDFARRVLVWGSAPVSAGESRLELRRSEGRFLVDLPQPGGSDHSMRFVPDSGATALVVYDRGRPVPLTAELVPGRAGLTSASGRQGHATMRRIHRLQVGALTLHNQIAAIVDRRQADAPDGDGLLPLHRFASVTFASGEGYIVIRGR